jgi:hypothetical protein
MCEGGGGREGGECVKEVEEQKRDIVGRSLRKRIGE